MLFVELLADKSTVELVDVVVLTVASLEELLAVESTVELVDVVVLTVASLEELLAVESTVELVDVVVLTVASFWELLAVESLVELVVVTVAFVVFDVLAVVESAKNMDGPKSAGRKLTCSVVLEKACRGFNEQLADALLEETNCS